MSPLPQAQTRPPGRDHPHPPEIRRSLSRSLHLGTPRLGRGGWGGGRRARSGPGTPRPNSADRASRAPQAADFPGATKPASGAALQRGPSATPTAKLRPLAAECDPRALAARAPSGPSREGGSDY